MKEYRGRQKPQNADVMVHVDEIASKIAQFYEQIRNVVDYREEHLLRKNSVLRSLQRHLLLRELNGEKIAEPLIKEIIRSGHLPNDAIPESRVADVQRIIENLLFLLDTVAARPKESSDLADWLTSITACAIEENLDPPHRDRLIADAMFSIFKERAVIKGSDVSENDRHSQLFIGIQRALLRVDDDQLAYHIVRFIYPQWDTMAYNDLAAIAHQLPAIQKSVSAYIHSPFSIPFFKLCNRYNTIFFLLRDAVTEHPELFDDTSVWEDDDQMNTLIEEAYQNRYQRQRVTLRRLAFFSVISLFLTKVIIAFAIEIPVDRYVTNDFSLPNALINILFPPLLMLIILGFIRLPSKRNLPLVIKETDAVIYEEKKKEYLIVIPKEKKLFMRRVVPLIYACVAAGVLYATVRILATIDFSIASTVVFILFTSIVAATGVRVHNRSKEISLEEDHPSLLGFLGDTLFMPFVTIGRLAMAGLSHVRVLVMIVNLIDVPFVVFLTFVENFNAFLRTKKDELH